MALTITSGAPDSQFFTVIINNFIYILTFHSYSPLLAETGAMVVSFVVISFQLLVFFLFRPSIFYISSINSSSSVSSLRTAFSSAMASSLTSSNWRSLIFSSLIFSTVFFFLAFLAFWEEFEIGHRLLISPNSLLLYYNLFESIL